MAKPTYKERQSPWVSPQHHHGGGGEQALEQQLRVHILLESSRQSKRDWAWHALLEPEHLLGSR